MSGSDVLIASELFGKSVKSDVPRHNDVRSGVDLQVIEGDSSLGEVVDLAEKILRVKNYACADKAEGVFIENTRGDTVKLIGLAVACNSVTRIVAALGTYNNICTGSQYINYLSLAFVATLGTDYDISRHLKFLIS